MNILSQIKAKTGQIAVLIDPEKTNHESALKTLIEKIVFAKVDFIFVGGSTVSREQFQKTVSIIKSLCSIPVVIFPGGSHQFSEKADALLFLSLVSGRNPDFLITHHIQAVPDIINSSIEVLPTAYLLVDGGTSSSVAYVSQTTPIPRNQENIVLDTALAAIFQGKQLVFLDAGSGAKQAVPASIIPKIKAHKDVPIIVGGGIQRIQDIERFKNCGANVIVIGNKIEAEIDFLLDIKLFKSQQDASN